jgi:hypothetical protein
MQAQIPKQFWKDPDPYSGPLLSADSSLSGTISRTNSMLNRFGIPEVFDKDFLSNNYLFSQDPISAGLKEVGRNVRGAALGAAASALNPEVAKAVEKNDYRAAGQTVLRDVATGAAVEGGIGALSTVAPRFAGAASTTLNTVAPFIVGYGLFKQGQPGSLTDVLTQKAAENPVSWMPSVKPNPQTDVGAQLSRSIPETVRTAVGSRQAAEVLPQLFPQQFGEPYSGVGRTAQITQTNPTKVGDVGGNRKTYAGPNWGWQSADSYNRLKQEGRLPWHDPQQAALNAYATFDRAVGGVLPGGAPGTPPVRTRPRSSSTPSSVSSTLNNVGNEVRYAGTALSHGRIPYLNAPIPFFGR